MCCINSPLFYVVAELEMKLSVQSGVFTADTLLASSVLVLYDKTMPSSAAICFRQATLSTLAVHFHHDSEFQALWCESLSQSLFLLSTAFVYSTWTLIPNILFHCRTWNDFESVSKWSHLAHHCAQCFADDHAVAVTVNEFCIISCTEFRQNFQKLCNRTNTTKCFKASNKLNANWTVHCLYLGTYSHKYTVFSLISVLWWYYLVSNTLTWVLPMYLAPIMQVLCLFSDSQLQPIQTSLWPHPLM